MQVKYAATGKSEFRGEAEHAISHITQRDGHTMVKTPFGMQCEDCIAMLIGIQERAYNGGLREARKRK